MLLDELRTSIPDRQPTGAFDDRAHMSFRLAQEIVSEMPAGSINRIEEYPDRIQFRTGSGHPYRIERIVIGRESLEKLQTDPQRDVKIEYLKRELGRSVSTRRTWAYPRTLALR